MCLPLLGSRLKEQELRQRSLTFLAPGTGFVEDNFSTDVVGDGSGSNVSDGEQWRAADEASLAHCSPPAVQPSS